MTAMAVVLLTAAIAAAIFDVRTHHIPNTLSGAVALAALAIHVPEGMIPLLVATASLCGVFALGTVAFSAGWFGGGDVKLIAACCGLVSFPGCVMLLLDVLLCGAMLALLVAARRRSLVVLLRSTAAVMRRGTPTEKIELPYAVAIAAGSVAYVVSTSVLALRLPV